MKLLGIMLIALAGISGVHAVETYQIPPSAAYLAAAHTEAQIAYVTCLQTRCDLTETQCSERAWSEAYKSYPRARPQAVVQTADLAPGVTTASSFAALERESAETRACVADIRSC